MLEKLNLDQFVRSGDTKGLEDLTLADIDFRVISQQHNPDRVSMYACLNFQNILKVFRKTKFC